jgi:hypothetical protein
VVRRILSLSRIGTWQQNGNVRQTKQRRRRNRSCEGPPGVSGGRQPPTQPADFVLGYVLARFLRRLGPGWRSERPGACYGPARQAAADLRQLSARLWACDGFLVAARALGLGLPRQVAGLVPARRQLAHLHRAVLRVDAAATTRVPGYDVRTRIAPVAVVRRHGVLDYAPYTASLDAL